MKESIESLGSKVLKLSRENNEKWEKCNKEISENHSYIDMAIAMELEGYKARAETLNDVFNLICKAEA